MEMEVRKYRVTGITPLLGSVCLDKEIYSKWLKTKCKTPEEMARADKDLDNVREAEEEEKQPTGFYRDANNNLILKGYQIKGFLKEGAKALKDQLGLTSYVSKIDNLVFINERDIPLMRDGKQITEADFYCERPLRAETPQGPRVAIARSEAVNEGYYFDMTVKVLKNAKSAKSRELTIDVVEEILAYGELKGLLQWRNAGYGSFKFEEIK